MSTRRSATASKKRGSRGPCSFEVFPTRRCGRGGCVRRPPRLFRLYPTVLSALLSARLRPLHSIARRVVHEAPAAGFAVDCSLPLSWERLLVVFRWVQGWKKRPKAFSSILSVGRHCTRPSGHHLIAVGCRSGRATGAGQPRCASVVPYVPAARRAVCQPRIVSRYFLGVIP